MAPHSSTLAWKIPWMEEPGGLQSMGLRRVRHDWVTSLSLSCIGEGNGNPLQCSCLENPRDRGAWWAAIYGVTQNWTRLEWLSSSSASVGLQCKIYLLLILTKIIKDTDIVNTHFVDKKIRPRKIKWLSQDPTTGQQRNPAGILLTSI